MSCCQNSDYSIYIPFEKCCNRNTRERQVAKIGSDCSRKVLELYKGIAFLWCIAWGILAFNSIIFSGHSVFVFQYFYFSFSLAITTTDSLDIEHRNKKKKKNLLVEVISLHSDHFLMFPPSCRSTLKYLFTQPTRYYPEVPEVVLEDIMFSVANSSGYHKEWSMVSLK